MFVQHHKNKNKIYEKKKIIIEYIVTLNRLKLYINLNIAMQSFLF